MTEQEAQVLRDTATSAEQNALLNSQKLVKMQENYELVCEILEQMIVGAVNTLDLAREVDRLVQERDALRVDAERYRWLRDRHADEARANGEVPNMDEVIDAAMEEKQ